MVLGAGPLFWWTMLRARVVECGQVRTLPAPSTQSRAQSCATARVDRWRRELGVPPLPSPPPPLPLLLIVASAENAPSVCADFVVGAHRADCLIDLRGVPGWRRHRAPRHRLRPIVLLLLPSQTLDDSENAEWRNVSSEQPEAG